MNLMIEPASFALFVGVSWALILAPGPDMLYVLTRGMAHGRRAGILSAVGVICGIHMPQYTKFLRWLTGGILFSLGVRLAFTDQR